MRVEDGSFGALRERLLKGGIAPRRVKRYLGELNDHLAELTARELAAGYTPDEARIRARALLGGDDELAESWLADSRLKSLTARAPWVVFGVLPPVAAICTLVPPTLFLIAVGKANRVMEAHTVAPEWFQHLAGAMVQAGNLVLVPLVTLLFVLMAQRQRLSALWPLLAAGMLLLLGLRMGYQAGTLDHRGSLSLGMGPLFLTGPNSLLAVKWPYASLQSFLTLLPAVWFLARQNWRRAA